MEDFAPIIVIIFALAVLVLLLVSVWKLFEKMGEEGWKAIVPILNNYTIAEKVGKPGYWALLVLIPYIGIIWGVWLLNLWLKGFGKDEGYTIFAVLLPYIALPLLAFDKNTTWIKDNTNEINQIGRD